MWSLFRKYIVAVMPLILVACTGIPTSQYRANFRVVPFPTNNRLVPNDYRANQVQFDSVQLPSTWYYMRDKWISDRSASGGRWPVVVIIDDGFFHHDDFGLPTPITTGPGFPYSGTSEGNVRSTCDGLHGTAVASLLGVINNNQQNWNTYWNAPSVAGPWIDPINNSGRLRWGVTIWPIRLNDTGFLAVGCGSESSMVQALNHAAGNDEQFTDRFPTGYPVRVINLSMSIVPDNDFVSAPPPGMREVFESLQAKATIVLASGNDAQVVNDKGWLANFDNVVIVGALNKDGTSYWDDGDGSGTRRGTAVDIYAPGEELVFINHPKLGPDRGTGVSFAAPIISGILAMMWNANPCMTPAEHIQVLLNTADPVTVSNGTVKRANALNAISTAYNNGGMNCNIETDDFDVNTGDALGRVAFVREHKDMKGNYISNIYVVNADGSEQMNLTKQNADFTTISRPSWSPDGTKIAFVDISVLNSKIYVMNSDGSQQMNLSNDFALDSNPVWSPDGTRIAFQNYHDGKIYVVNSNGTGKKNLMNKATSGYNPSWSPDGTKIAFETSRDGNNEIYIMNTDGSDQINLTNNPASDLGPVWSPDGTKIAFVSDRGSDQHVGYFMHVMNSVDGSNQQSFGSYGVFSSTPPSYDWSPDGERIVYGSHDSIYLLNMDGTGDKFLTSGGYSGFPKWSPDGKWIVFESSQVTPEHKIGGIPVDRVSDIYVMDREGSGKIKLSPQPIHIWKLCLENSNCTEHNVSRYAIWQPRP